jgi:hypothetical protein
MMWAGAGIAIVAILLLRFAWGRPRRSTRLNALGWALLALGIISSASDYGAWGVTVAGLMSTATALILLMIAAIRDRTEPKRPSERRANILPEDESLFLGRRALTFTLTIPVAATVALILSVAARALADMASWHPSNGTILALMLFPLIWAMLASSLLMAERLQSKGLVLLLPACVGGLILMVAGV